MAVVTGTLLASLKTFAASKAKGAMIKGAVKKYAKDKVKKIAKDKLLGRGKKKKGTQPEGEEQQQEEETGGALVKAGSSSLYLLVLLHQLQQLVRVLVGMM